MKSRSDSGVVQRRRRGLASAEGVVAVGAVSGSLGLAVRSIDFGSTINARLPFESPEFAGCALFLIVGVPMTSAAIAAWRGSRLADPWAMSAGALLTGWIVVEIGVIRAFSWLQPTLLTLGVAIAFAGHRGWHLTWGSRDGEIDARMPGDEIESEPWGSVDLYWIPLGADANVVRISGKLFEIVSALVQRRPRRALFHSALQVYVPEGRFVIEQAPIPDTLGDRRGVVAEGPVGTQWAGRFRVFRYEVRCWREGRIPDLPSAVTSPVRLACDVTQARRVLDALPSIPTPIWGRDELHLGEMWNSNSVTAWTLASSGCDIAGVTPPKGGRAPGWEAGIVAATRHLKGKGSLSPRVEAPSG